jgi:hypothetical protein
MGREQGIARIGALQQAADDEAIGQLGGHVLHGVDRHIDLAGDQRLLDLLGKQALAADLVQLAILDLVAGGLDDDDLRERQIGICCGELVAHHPRLHQRQRTSPRPDAQAFWRSRHETRFSGWPRPKQGEWVRQRGCGECVIIKPPAPLSSPSPPQLGRRGSG